MIEQLKNGAFVLDETPYRTGDDSVAKCRIVLALAPQSADPFVTWVVNDDQGTALSGSYHRTLEEAQADYAARCLGAAGVGRVAA